MGSSEHKGDTPLAVAFAKAAHGAIERAGRTGASQLIRWFFRWNPEIPLLGSSQDEEPWARFTRPADDTFFFGRGMAVSAGSRHTGDFAAATDLLNHFRENTIFCETGYTERFPLTAMVYCGFDSGPTEAYPAAFAWIPALQVCPTDEGLVVCAQLLVTEKMTYEDVHAEFGKLGPFFKPRDRLVPAPTSIEKVGESADYLVAVSKAQKAMRERGLSKVVIARTVDYAADKDFDLLTTVEVAEDTYQNCMIVAMGFPAGEVFIAATPETLVKGACGRVYTEALAGTQRLGDLLTQPPLMEDPKQRAEHACVVDFITAKLRSLNLEPHMPFSPALKQAGAVIHLCTPIEAELTPGRTMLEVAQALFPTPAVCGMTIEASKVVISQCEPFKRGLYAGAMGFIDEHGAGELVVGLRCAMVKGNWARLYAGAGIMPQSDPQAELQETEAKFTAMQRCLGVDDFL